MLDGLEIGMKPTLPYQLTWVDTVARAAIHTARVRIPAVILLTNAYRAM